jgi:hypothetical protein
MASYTPPTESLPIFDNEVFQSTNSSTVLTVGTANLLYLRKTFTDTATALETFSAGILTNLLNPITASSTIDIATNSTGVINIGTLGGRSTVIHIGDGNSNVSGGAVHINNGTSTASNVQILNGAGSTGTITLGSTTSTLTVNSPLTWGYSTGYTPSSTQLGYKVSFISGLSGTTSGTGGTITAPQSFSLPVGVWIINAVSQALTNSNYITTSIKIGAAGIASHDATNWCVVTNAGATNPTLTNNTTLINATSATVSYNYLIQASAASVSITGIYVFGTRIA